jgi:hypothetical protein
MFRRGRDVTLAARHRCLTSEDRIRSQVIPCEICGQSVALVQVFFSEYLGCSLSVSFRQCCLFIGSEGKRVRHGSLAMLLRTAVSVGQEGIPTVYNVQAF